MNVACFQVASVQTQEMGVSVNSLEKQPVHGYESSLPQSCIHT